MSVPRKPVLHSKLKPTLPKSVSTNTSISSANTSISSIRSDSVSSISTIRSNRTFQSTTEIDFKKSSPDDLIKKIENLVTRNRQLEEENSVLKNLINEESNKSSHDERRILMLKSQIYQLEKQINILSRSISFRKHAHTDSFNTLCFLTDSFRAITQHENRLASYYEVDKNELGRWIDLAESSKLKLNRTQNEEDQNETSDVLLFDSNYTNKTTNILDVCSGTLNHLNLKQVGVLESNLSQLYKKLTRLRESLNTNKNRKKVDPLQGENLKNQIEESLKSTSECCKNLFDLSLLIPSAPWSVIKKSPIEQLTQESLMNKLKSISLPKSKQQPVEILLKSLFISQNYHFHMKSAECAGINEELNFYRSCNTIQKTYIESVMELFRVKYEQFIKELSDNIKDPLRVLVDKFWLMKEKSNEETLKDFLGVFKTYVKIFDKVINSFESIPTGDVIMRTFNQLLVQLDAEVARLNEDSKVKLKQLDLESIDLKNLSLESDELLLDYLKPTPNSSPDNTLVD